MNRFYLKGLNSYRAIAALIVIVGHIEIFKQKNRFDNALNLPFFKYTGQHIAVILFFTLSGFLITMLLLREKDKFVSVNLHQFYLRRIFRVWPLYYFLLFLSCFLLNYTPFQNIVFLCLTISQNIAHAFDIGWYACFLSSFLYIFILTIQPHELISVLTKFKNDTHTNTTSMQLNLFFTKKILTFNA
jgi:peptidoglycan/LPS O-acetylase OafA/YrhL